MEEIDNITVDEIGIHSLLKNFKINKATGPDELPARLLKELSNELSPILVVLFQASLNQGKVPQDWKLANDLVTGEDFLKDTVVKMGWVWANDCE